MDRENYIMGQNYTSMVTSPFLCCDDSQSNYCTYVSFNDVELVFTAKCSIWESLQRVQHSNPADWNVLQAETVSTAEQFEKNSVFKVSNNTLNIFNFFNNNISALTQKWKCGFIDFYYSKS